LRPEDFASYKRLVGALEQRLGASRRWRGLAHADAYRDLEIVCAPFDTMENGPLDLLTQAFRHLCGYLRGNWRRVRHDDDELLAAIAAGQIHAAHIVAQPPGKFAQHIVAGIVAMGVVDVLEAVDVGDQQRQVACRG
jgi:hypothetical protein